MSGVGTDMMLSLSQMISNYLNQSGQTQPTSEATSEDSGMTPEQIFKRNQAYVKSGNHTYNTPLTPEQEQSFRAWVQQNNVAFDPASKSSDYDMRGYWLALQQGDPKARSGVDPNDKKLHYPDYWKTPYDYTFSNESQWADPAKAPKWTNDDKLALPDGTVLFDDRAQKKKATN